MARVKRGVTAHAKHKKVIAKAKVIPEDVKTSIVLPFKQLPKQDNMRIEIVVKENVSFVPYGLPESMPLPGNAAFHTVD